jgi:hypothetical protein
VLALSMVAHAFIFGAGAHDLSEIGLNRVLFSFCPFGSDAGSFDRLTLAMSRDGGKYGFPQIARAL